MTIVLIDLGICNSFCNVIGGIHIYEKNNQFIIDKNYIDEIGHGTAIADLITKYNNNNLMFYIIKIFESINDVINVDTLCYALNYILENVDCDIIQISLGVLEYSKRLNNLINKLVDRDICIISAFDNNGAISYPAAFPNVIGVDITNNYNKIDNFDLLLDDIVDIVGPDIYYHVKWKDNKNNIVKGSSFYCSYITAVISKIYTKHMPKKLKN